MTLFHTPTAYLILSFLYFVMPTITWFVLRDHRTLAVKLWCGGGLSMGVGVLLIGLRGHVPAWATFPLANFLLFVYLMMRIQSLRLDLTVPWRREWMVAAALLFVLVLESIRLGLGNLMLMVIYNNSVYTVISYYLATLAWRLGLQQKSHSAFWIAWSYRAMAVATLLFAIVYSTRWGTTPSPAILEPNPFRLVIIIVIIPFMVISHIAYIGLILERSHHQRIEMEHELRASEARFRGYFELPLTGRAITSPSMGWVEVNATLCDMLGYSKTELTQMTWAELTHPDDLTADLEQFNRVVDGEIDGYTVEKRFIHKNGQSVQTHLAVHCLRKPDQTVDYFISLILDISDWRRAEESLREINARFDELVRRIPVGIYTLRLSSDGSLNFEYCSEKFCQIMGADERDVLRDVESVFGLIHPDDRASLDEANLYAVQTLEPFRWEGRFLLVGDTRWLRIESEPTLLPNGDSLWNGVINDITERKLAEESLRESEVKFRLAFTNANTGMCLVDLQGNLLQVNEKMSAIFGYSKHELESMSVNDLALPDDKRISLEFIHHAIQGCEDNITFEKHYRHRLGKTICCQVSSSLLRDAQGQPEYFISQVQDITEQKQAETALKNSEERLRLITDIAPVFLAEIDKELCYRFVNRRYADMFGLPPGKFCGKHVSTIISKQAFAKVQPYMLKALTGQPVEFETELNETPEGYKFVAARYAPRHDDTGQIIGFVAAINDITERKQAEEEIKQLAFYDPLTQLPNRRLLLDRLRQAMVNSERDKTHGALLFIDLDNFKTLNDRLGHDQGDLLLQQVASRITAGIRESDTVARFGGDEFVVMLTGLAGDIEEAATQAQKIGWKIIDNLNRTYSTASYEHYCSASIGITLFVGQGSSIDELLKMADIAMYQAKAAGRNTLSFFDPQMQPSLKSS